MKNKFLFFAILIIGILPLTIYAQAPLTLTSLQVALWPEYDRPSMLVIYRIHLPPDTPLPVTLSFRIPVEAGKPNAVAVLVDNELVTTEYDMTSKGEWSQVTFTSGALTAQLEYYDPTLVKDGSDRSFSYTWTGDYAVENLLVEAQQPINADRFSSSPALGDGVTGNDGLVYYNQSFGKWQAGEEFMFSLNYSKTGDELSAAPQRLSQEGEGISSLVSGFNLLWVIIPAALGLIAFGLYGLFGKKHTSLRRNSEPMVRRVGKKPGVYCHQCGQRALKGDKFCRECGTKLRG